MSSTLYVDNLIEKTSGNGVHIPGHVVQVAYSNSTGSSTSVATMTNSAANTATGFYADITPTSTSSKIVVLLTSNLQHTPSEGQGIIWGMRRNGSAIARNGASDYIEYGQQTNFHTTVNLNYVDAPASTSSLRYELYLSNYGGGVSVVRNWGTTNITLMEIAQ